MVDRQQIKDLTDVRRELDAIGGFGDLKHAALLELLAITHALGLEEGFDHSYKAGQKAGRDAEIASRGESTEPGFAGWDLRDI